MTLRRASATFTLLLVWGVFAACHRETALAETSASSSVPPIGVSKSGAAKPAAAGGLKRAPVSQQTAPGRVLAIGDLHGDLTAAIGALKLAKVINETEQWIGGNSVVVQTGDVLDRGTQERALLDFLDKIESRAKAGGGALYRLNGNHEIMNVAGDLRYVSAEGFADFADAANGPFQPNVGQVPALARGRKLSFLPGRPWAVKLSQYPVVLVVNDSVFAHGGVRLEHVKYGLSRMNGEVSAWMRGEAPLPTALQGDDSPYWIRDYGEEVTPEVCAKLERVLAGLSAKRLIVGHTVQKDGISFACDGKVARIDVGLSSYYGNRAPTVLEISGGTMKILDGSSKPTEGRAR